MKRLEDRRVNAIKEVRCVSDAALTEAKELVDAVSWSAKPRKVITNKTMDELSDHIQNFQRIGCSVRLELTPTFEA